MAQMGNITVKAGWAMHICRENDQPLAFLTCGSPRCVLSSPVYQVRRVAFVVACHSELGLHQASHILKKLVYNLTRLLVVSLLGRLHPHPHLDHPSSHQEVGAPGLTAATSCSRYWTTSQRVSVVKSSFSSVPSSRNTTSYQVSLTPRQGHKYRDKVWLFRAPLSGSSLLLLISERSV